MLSITNTIMKKIFLLITLIIFFVSCKTHLTPEQEKQKAIEEAQRKRDSIAAPLIANEIAELNILVSSAKDTNLSSFQRQSSMDKLRKTFVEYMGAAVSPETYTGKPAETYFKDEAGLQLGEKIMRDSVFSKKFDAAVEMQKKFIKGKWNYYAAQQVYKAALQRQIEAEQELERVKNK